MTSTSFMVGLKSPNDTHKKSERHETCGSAPPARKAWSHEGPSDVADPRTGIRFAIDPPDWLEEPIAKRHTTLPKPFTSFGFSTQIPLQSWSNNANAQPSYGGLSSPTISFLYVPANYHETKTRLNLEPSSVCRKTLYEGPPSSQSQVSENPNWTCLKAAKTIVLV
ncbi:hypothetical protein V6N11_009816 [Hibiscus sabdariffa]|uniref:Uncharacterized protein n=1 Tax=Hibiscus sabdariffa TaxID=183260 RepID=A0ABR1ZLP0_9ROSI